MKRTLALAMLISVCGAAYATEATRASLHLAKLTPMVLQQNHAGRNAQMVLQDEDVDVQIVGPVARMVVTQTWRYDGNWFSPGDEAVCEVRTGPVSAIFDYWITEGDAVHKGIIRDRRSANAEYAKNLEQRRDPGLVEWVDEGLYRLRLYPVPKNGGLKKQSFTLLTVLPLKGDGTVKMEWALPDHRVERLTWRIRVAGGTLAAAAGGVPDGSLVKLVPSADGKALQGELTKLPEANKKLELVVQHTPRASRAWRTANGQGFVQVSEAVVDPEGDRGRFLACIAAAGTERELAAVTGLPLAEAPAPDPEPLPDAWLPPLAAAARALRLELDENKSLDAQTALANAAIVGPNVVLFANPFTNADAIKAGWEQAQKEASARQAANPVAGVPAALPPAPPAVPLSPPPAPSAFSQLDFSLPSGLLAPTFKAARERANTRACFANQKTVIGAIEMYNLDRNTKAQAAVLAPPCWHATPAPPPPPAEPVLRLVSPPAGVEWAYWRDRKRMEVYRQLHGLSDAPAAAAPVVETVNYHLPQGYGLGFVESRGMAGRIPNWLWQDLKNGGYLQSIPQDPSFGPETESNYCLTSWGNGITCLSHGEIQPRLGSGVPARNQLVSEGVYNTDLLNSALDYVPSPGSSYERRSAVPLGWVLLGLGLVLATWLLALPFVWFEPIKELRPGIRDGLWSAFKSALWAVPAALLGPVLLLPLGYAALRAGVAVAGMTALLLRVLFED